jgi:hypothetical protein
VLELWALVTVTAVTLAPGGVGAAGLELLLPHDTKRAVPTTAARNRATDLITPAS